MKFQEYHGEVGNWPALIVLPVLAEGVSVWVPFQLGTESVLVFFPGPFHLPGLRWDQGPKHNKGNKNLYCKLIGREDRKERSFSTPSLSSSGLRTLVVKGRIKLHFIIKLF